ncbi:hypothetical protein KIH74_02655 [Kineosporia sp. J2-2]|uniref:ANTAR domain-containing protein n=1 Tax=Kineosporia corallincola TaxID=2835133 RepID=A0ABS5T9T0_9ACTN|nr:hypothetical protein [Kineosporia corallincola]MBT0767808.1 hypothetical protein [Kineosporia corallincola]
MTTTGRPSRPDAAQPESLQSSTPLRELLNAMIGLLLAEITDGSDSEQLKRYVAPLTMCLALDRDLTDQAGVAREAVARVQGQQMTDLATGVLMARLGCDIPAARNLLSEWLGQKGLEPATLTPAEIQMLLEEPDWGRR